MAVPLPAGVAELADAHGSGPCWLRLVWVQVPPPAPPIERAPIHPRARRCSSLAYDEYAALPAPCARGVSALRGRDQDPATLFNHRSTRRQPGRVACDGHV